MKTLNIGSGKYKDNNGEWSTLPCLKGDKGNTGESAYQLAVRLGTFTGTEEEYNKQFSEIVRKTNAAEKSIKEAENKIQENIKNINSLSKDLKTKINIPLENPEIGKVLKVKSINEDGTFVCEWADSASDLDVQIDGKSIVQNGVAEIPLANRDNVLGVIKTIPYEFWETGVGANGTTGQLQLYPASEKNIDARQKINVSPISVKNLDYAVKAAMCDGKGAAWTTDEQVAARERMGALGTQDMIDITEITMDAETLKYVFPSFENYRILEISFSKTNKAITGLTGNIWLRNANGAGWVLTNAFSYAYNMLILDASGKSCTGKIMFTNNTQIVINMQGLIIDKKYWNTEFREAPYFLLPNIEWAQYFAECHTVIKVRGIKR